jgi:hypothetical protein
MVTIKISDKEKTDAEHVAAIQRVIDFNERQSRELEKEYEEYATENSNEK